MPKVKLPITANSIQKGVPLKNILGRDAVMQLAENLSLTNSNFKANGFIEKVMADIEPLTIKERGYLIAKTLKEYLPNNYSEAISYLLNSLTPPLAQTEDMGLSGFFYLPHTSFIELYGLDKEYNNNTDPFEISMQAQYELTKRFTAEYSIRIFLIEQQARTFELLYQWMNNPDPHIRRLCSEGTRPRLPWGKMIPSLAKDPSPSLPILEKLKDDEDLYVRRSVANHIGDIAKDNLDLALNICKSWLPNSSNELKLIIRHALRYPAKKGNEEALNLRLEAKKI